MLCSTCHYNVCNLIYTAKTISLASFLISYAISGQLLKNTTLNFEIDQSAIRVTGFGIEKC